MNPLHLYVSIRKACEFAGYHQDSAAMLPNGLAARRTPSCRYNFYALKMSKLVERTYQPLSTFELSLPESLLIK